MLMIDTIIEIEKDAPLKEFANISGHGEEKRKKGIMLAIMENKKLLPSTSDYLVAFSTQSQSFCVGYVDIVNSTKISATLSTEKLSSYYEIFLNSMSKIVGKFGGNVIKNIGDCLLYYFPDSVNASEKGLKDCLDCGITMSNAQSNIRQQLASKNLPSLNYRISADFGTVIRMSTNISSEVDLIGPPVNMCAKINGCADSNEFVIGNDLHQVARKFKTYDFGEIQSFDLGFKYPYPVYRVTPSFR